MGVARLRRRLLLAVVAACLGTGVFAGAAGADGFLVGVDENALQTGDPQLTTSIAEALGVQAIRIAVPWTPGETALSGTEEQQPDNAVVAAWGLSIVDTIIGSAQDAPRTDAARSQYCSFAADILSRHSTLDDVVIW